MGTQRRAIALVAVVATAAICGWIGAGTAFAAPPMNTAQPVITGTPEQGQTLTVAPGTWNPPSTPTDQWQDCTGTTCTDISGATGTTYIPTAADVGHTINVSETVTGAAAPVQAVAATGTITGNSALPTITGTAQQGQTLTLHQGTWTNSPTSITDQWESCLGGICNPVSATTPGTYVVTASDVGRTIDVVETATDSVGTGTLTAISAPTAAVTPGVGPTPGSAPAITGTLQQGGVLAVQQGTWSPAPTGISDQWWRCNAQGGGCVAVVTAPTYTLTAADVGSRMQVIETATDAAGSSSAPSALTGVVPGLIPVPVVQAAPNVTGLAQEGQTLVASTGSWTGSPTSFGYQWERCHGSTCTPIPGATGQAYTASSGDVGDALAVLGTASNGGGSSAPAESARTAVVVATSSLSLVALPGGPTADQTVTLVATVGSGSVNTAPGGSVTFVNGGTPIPGCANEAFQSNSQSITLICQASFAAGAVNVGAVFQPGAGSFLAGSAGQLTLNVTRDTTSMSLAVTKQVSRSGRAVYTATVLLPRSNSGPADPTGWVAFLDRGRAIRSCQRRPLKRLSATCTMKYRSLGRHEISALYSGDANFGGSRSDPRTVRIVRGSTGPLVEGFVSSVLEWQFAYRPHYTMVTGLRADGLTKGMTIVMGCHGGGCAFTHISIPVGRSTSVNLMSRFRRRRLHVGTQITLWMIRPHWVGKYYSFTVRAGQGPQIGLSCLGVGSLRPGVGC